MDPEVRKKAEAQKAAWAEADVRKAAASLQSNAAVEPSTAAPYGLSRLIIPLPHSESPALSPLQLPTFPPALATPVDSPVLSKRPLPLKRVKSGSFRSDSPFRQWDAVTQNDFNDDLLNVFVANNFSWNSANNLEFIKFMTKWILGAVVPDRRALSGSILDRQSQKVETRMRDKLDGKLATGQCDGWKSNAKVSVVAMMVTVDNEVCCYKISNSITIS